MSLLALLFGPVPPIEPGTVLTDGPVEGLIAGEATQIASGDWLVEVKAGELNRSPVSDERTPILATLLERQSHADVAHLVCSMAATQSGNQCVPFTVGTHGWPSQCEVRDFVQLSYNDVVRIEWNCDDQFKAMSLVQFERDEVIGVRTLLEIVPILVTDVEKSPDSKEPPSLEELFAEHDPYGRLPNTKILKLGELIVSPNVYAIYYLTFVNPVSRHGQHRIAIIRNSTEFMGAYQCWLEEGGAELTIGEDRLSVLVGEAEFVIEFDEHGPSHNEYFCGEGTGWEDSI